jgi:hypothetical protein
LFERATLEPSLISLSLLLSPPQAQTEGMSPADAEALEGALRASGAEAAALGFIKRMVGLCTR